MSLNVHNETFCIQECIFRFIQPVGDAAGENNICLTTAAIGTFILFSGLNDISRICASEFGGQRRKYLCIGNGTIVLFALAKIAAGISFISNAFLYKPYLWNTELGAKCQSSCIDMIENFRAPPPYGYTNPCCVRCYNDLSLPSESQNYKFGLGWGISLACIGGIKMIYHICRLVTEVRKWCILKPLVDLPTREWKIANPAFMHDLLEVICSVAIFVFITFNNLADDENIYDATMSSSLGSSSSDALKDKCLGFCNLFYKGYPGIDEGSCL